MSTSLSAQVQHRQDADLFRLLVDRVVDYAIFLLTPDGHIASWNAGAQRLKGYVLDEAWRTGQAAFGDSWAVLPLLSEARPTALLGVTLDDLQELAPDER
jgi:hypothetical protein